MKREEIAKILVAAACVFPTVTLTPDAINIWFTLFKQVEAKVFYAALFVCIKEAGRKFFPTPGEVNEILLRDSIRHITAEEVWEFAVSQAARSQSCFSETQKLILGEFLENAETAARSVGWSRIRFANTESELCFVRRDFINTFNSTLERDQVWNQAQIESTEKKILIDDIEARKNQKLLENLCSSVVKTF